MKEKFPNLWKKYFGNAELPIAFYDTDDTITPFGLGCSSIIFYPYRERLKERQRADIGLFDTSARPFVGENMLTFALPVKRLIEMTNYIEESFLITESWQVVKKRILKSTGNQLFESKK